MSILGHQVSSGRVGLVAVPMLLLLGALAAGMAPDAAPDREITLVARNMAFYLAGDPRTPNPPIRVQPGERVRIVLRNEDRGYVHDFAIPVLEAAVSLVDWSRSAHVTFTAPDAPGSYEYVCQPHRLMMRGVLEVADERPPDPPSGS